MTDTYEGWSNRETWCANLWLANDEGLYEMTREAARDAIEQALGDDDQSRSDVMFEASYALANSLRDMFEEWEYGEGEDDYTPAPGVYKVLRDIGSLYRVEWGEVAEGWIRDAMEEEK